MFAFTAIMFWSRIEDLKEDHHCSNMQDSLKTYKSLQFHHLSKRNQKIKDQTKTPIEIKIILK